MSAPLQLEGGIRVLASRSGVPVCHWPLQQFEIKTMSSPGWLVFPFWDGKKVLDKSNLPSISFANEAKPTRTIVLYGVPVTSNWNSAVLSFLKIWLAYAFSVVAGTAKSFIAIHMAFAPAFAHARFVSLSATAPHANEPDIAILYSSTHLSWILLLLAVFIVLVAELVLVTVLIQIARLSLHTKNKIGN